jgi:hypothetical protein
MSLKWNTQCNRMLQYNIISSVVARLSVNVNILAPNISAIHRSWKSQNCDSLVNDFNSSDCVSLTEDTTSLNKNSVGGIFREMTVSLLVDQTKNTNFLKKSGSHGIKMDYLPHIIFLKYLLQDSFKAVIREEYFRKYVY